MTDNLRIVADYQMMGDLEGREWATLVLSHAQAEGKIAGYQTTGVHPMVGGLQFVQFTIDVPDTALGLLTDWRTVRDRATALLNEIVGDSDVQVHTIYAASDAEKAPSVGKYEALWALQHPSGMLWSMDKRDWVTQDSGEFTSFTDGEMPVDDGEFVNLNEV